MAAARRQRPTVGGDRQWEGVAASGGGGGGRRWMTTERGGGGGGGGSREGEHRILERMRREFFSHQKM
ncbi:hypothetical protein Tco_0112198 [Tanacetum coccineum]